MFIIITCMLLGIAVGYFLRNKNARFIQRIIITFIWLLLFLLGLEVGGNEQVMKQSGKIIFQAFLIASAGTLGSVMAARFLWKRSASNSQKEDEDVFGKNK